MHCTMRLHWAVSPEMRIRVALFTPNLLLLLQLVTTTTTTTTAATKREFKSTKTPSESPALNYIKPAK